MNNLPQQNFNITIDELDHLNEKNQTTDELSKKDGLVDKQEQKIYTNFSKITQDVTASHFDSVVGNQLKEYLKTRLDLNDITVFEQAKYQNIFNKLINSLHELRAETNQQNDQVLYQTKVHLELLKEKLKIKDPQINSYKKFHSVTNISLENFSDNADGILLNNRSVEYRKLIANRSEQTSISDDEFHSAVLEQSIPNKTIFSVDRFGFPQFVLLIGGAFSAITTAAALMNRSPETALGPGMIAYYSFNALDKTVFEPNEVPQPGSDKFSELCQKPAYRHIDQNFMATLAEGKNIAKYLLYLNTDPNFKVTQYPLARRQLNNNLLSSINFNNFETAFSKIQKSLGEQNFEEIDNWRKQEIIFNFLSDPNYSNARGAQLVQDLKNLNQSNLKADDQGQIKPENTEALENEKCIIYEGFYQILAWMDEMKVYNNQRIHAFENFSTYLQTVYSPSTISRILGKVFST